MWMITANDLPYRGVACDKVGVPLGKLYATQVKALNDLKKVQRYSRQRLIVKPVDCNQE